MGETVKGSKCGCHPLHAGDLTGLDSLCGEEELKAPSGVHGVEGQSPLKLTILCILISNFHAFCMTFIIKYQFLCLFMKIRDMKSMTGTRDKTRQIRDDPGKYGTSGHPAWMTD